MLELAGKTIKTGITILYVKRVKKRQGRYFFKKITLLELKTIQFHNIITLEGISSRFDIVKTKTSEAEDRVIENNQNEMEREKRILKNEQNF